MAEEQKDAENGIKTMKLYSHVTRIYNEIKELGIKDTDPLSEELLSKFDQYHYYGTSPVDEAIQELELSSKSCILDVGSGLGGPARHIATRVGCHVTAVEMQENLNDTAKHLTSRCGLQDRILHVCGDINKLKLDTSFDDIVSWLVFCHIPEKRELLSKCYGYLKDQGKILIEDYFKKGVLTVDEEESLAKDMFSINLPTREEYVQTLQASGFRNVKFIDLTDTWLPFVVKRPETYRSMKERHVRVHGNEVYQEQEYFFSAMAKLIKGGNLGGCRIVAEK